MATSLVAQLQRLAVPESEPRKRPFTRPSILFDPKEAADIDLDSLLNIALSGLEVLVSIEEKFKKYKNDLFSYGSKELDRDLMGIEENNRINASIRSYLQLLSGYFELSAALKTLEYLIRRYKIHMYNTEELILCALPYHDTHVFVRVVQLIDTGNSKWKFLEGVKASGAPLPRKVIVQQCIRDSGILEVLSNYVTSSKKVQPSKPVTGFCTAVIFEVLGSLTAIDSEVVRRVIPFVECGLQPGARGGVDQKAGALMIVSLLADKVALSPKVVKSLTRSLAEVARADARDSIDLQWCRMSLMALINLVQLQSVEIIPKKVLDILKDIRDISVLLSELAEEFNTGKFMALFLDSLVEYSCSDDLLHGTLLSMVEMVPLKDLVARIVTKLLNTSLRILKDNDSSAAETGTRCNLILVSLLKKYLVESREAVSRYVEDIKLRSKNDYGIVIGMLNCNLELSHEISDSKIWFALEHPKAEVRRSALLGLDVRAILNVEAADTQRFGTIRDAIMRRLYDEDLTVVQAALKVEALPEILSASLCIDAFQKILQKCIAILTSSASRGASLAVDVALSCLQHAAARLPDEDEYVKMVAALVFPFIMILPKTQRLNLKALEVAKQMKWPFYENLVGVPVLDKKLDSGNISSINVGNINVLAKALSTHPEEHLPWLIECCKTSELSKTLFLLVLLQSFALLETGDARFSAFFSTCFPILRMEWELLESAGNVSDELNPGLWERDTGGLIEHMGTTNPEAFNSEIMTCLFLRLLGSFSKTAAESELLDKNEKRLSCFRDLFVFFVTRRNHVFKKHLFNAVAKCKIQTPRFLSEFFTDEGVSAAVLIGSLHTFSSVCAHPDETLTFQLLAEFPSILVPLSSDNQDVRTAAMNTIEALLSLWSHVNLSRSKNGLHAVWVRFLGELLGIMVQQKRLLISDKNVLSSLFSSLLGSCNDSLLVQHNIGKRYDQTTKDEILASLIGSGLRYSAYAKMKILSLLKGVGDRVIRGNGVDVLMLDLLDRRQKYHIAFDKSCLKLSQVEISILCLLLEMSIMPSTTTMGDHAFLDPILKALQVTDVASGDPAVLRPCMTVLGSLSNSFYASLKTETQDDVFRHLVLLYRSTNGDIQKATREALLRINITCSIVSRLLEFICQQKVWSSGSRHGKKKKKGIACDNRDIIPGGGNVVAFVASLLDVLLLKKDMENRTSLICPLFKLLHNAFIDYEWIHVAANQDDLHYHASSENSQSISDAAVHIQQELLLILEDITTSVTSEDENFMNFDVELLVKCARSTSSLVTRNQIFSLLSAISRAKPEKVLDHILEILVVIGESAVTQWDNNFQHIFEDLISAVVPCWLSKTDSADALLQVFVNILPQVSEHRRISMIVHVLRHLGESVSIGSLLYLLFHSLAARNCFSLHDRSEPSLSYSISLIHTQWEYLFAVHLLEKYSCTVWLPSVLMLLQRIADSGNDEALFMELLVAVYFISNILQNPEIAFKLDLGEDLDNIQLTIGAITKEIVCHLQLVDSKRKQTGVLSVFRKELKEYMNTVLRAVTKRVTPSIYFKAIVQLLGHVDKHVKKKALGTLCETVKDTGFIDLKHERRGSALNSGSSWFHLDENSLQSLNTLCLEILKLVNSQNESSSLKLAAISTLEVLANRFPSDSSVFSLCLDSVSKSISTDDSSLSSSCLRTAGALITVLGPKALPQLPFVMEGMIRQSRNASSSLTAETKQTDGDASNFSSIQKGSVSMSILLALEAVVNKLGGFLNPYLSDILEFMILKPQYTSTSELKLKSKADSIRKLITDRVPVRLLLSPLLRIYSDATVCGDSTVSIAFEMIENLVVAMDRSSIGAYHVRIFDLCLQALDLRRQHPAAVRNVDAVEKNVINTVVALTMKLTEKMFRPLFMRSIEWSVSIVEENENAGTKSIDRSIAFYGLVNRLADSHRSLFVPYFKYLLDGCVKHLMDAGDANLALNHKKKKVKLQEGINRKEDADSGLFIGLWHLRALILSSLHKSFLYDTGTLKFLDSANFQVLLKPIVSQLVTDPPATLQQHPNVPSVEEVDDLLVACVGQMAITAGSDLLWKPLNHEVLLQTRSEKLRSRILGLRIVKYLVENLKEEYLVLLAETIPFLGELLEDVELPVKSLAQEILKEMESMSGESLRQYL